MRYALCLALSAAACDGAKDAEPNTGETGLNTEEAGLSAGPLAIIGEYTDIYGTFHAITDAQWSQQYGSYTPSIFTITSHDNASRTLIAQNDPLNSYFPDLWSRFDWVEADGHLYYCQSAYNAASEEQAQATARADDSDPAVGGCGGFAWTDLTP